MSVAQARFIYHTTAEELQQGELRFKILPDKSIEVDISGNLQDASTIGEPLPIQSMSLDLTLSPSATDLTRVEGGSMIKFTPTYSEQLSALDLALNVHSVKNADEMTIQFKLEDYLGVEGTINRSTDEATSETAITFELTAEIWYSAVPKEAIQEITQNFPLYKQQLESEISQRMNGKLEITELNLVSSSLDSTSATLIISGKIIGDLYQGVTNLITQKTEQEIVPTKIINSVKIRSGDLHIEFDKTELAFEIGFNWIVEGDINKQANDMKNLLADECLQSSTVTPKMSMVINDLMIPAELNIENLNAHYESTFDSQLMTSNFNLSGLKFTSPTQETFFRNLNIALSEYPLPGYKIAFEGGSDDTSYLEIVAAQTAPEPVENDLRTAVFSTSDLTNLDKISFETRQWPTSTISLNQTNLTEGGMIKVEGTLIQEGDPVIGQSVDISANNIWVGTAKTDINGGYSLTYRFEDTGTYEVKSSLIFYEKNIESQPVLVTVNPPASGLTNLILPVAGVAIILTAVAGVILYTRKAPVK